MGKLFKLKEWLTLPDAAQHLSAIFEEEVKEADVLRLGLDGHLKLSVRFVNNALARRGKVVPLADARVSEMPSLFDPDKMVKIVPGLRIGEEEILELCEEIIKLNGVWDLAMIGSERHDVEREYQNRTGGPDVTDIYLDGTFVERQDGTYFQLQTSLDDNEYQPGSNAQLEKIKEDIARDNIVPLKAKILLDQAEGDRKTYLKNKRENDESGKRHKDYYPAQSLPGDSVFVVRTSALQKLQATIAEPDRQVHSTGLPGKPTSWFLVETEIRRRWDPDFANMKIVELARVMLDWLKLHHPDAPVPTIKTLTNNLAGLGRELRAATKLN